MPSNLFYLHSRCRDPPQSYPEDEGNSIVEVEVQLPYPFNQSLLSCGEGEDDNEHEVPDLSWHPKPLGVSAESRGREFFVVKTGIAPTAGLRCFIGSHNELFPTGFSKNTHVLLFIQNCVVVLFVLQLCTFGCRTLGCNIFTFDRRWQHLRLALSAMLEQHVNAHL